MNTLRLKPSGGAVVGMLSLCVLACEPTYNVPPTPTKRQSEFELQVAPGAAGTYPANYKALVASEVRAMFRDPYSLRDVGLTQPFQATAKQTGWMVCLVANAKNAYGAYTGQQTFGFLIKEGGIVQKFPYFAPVTVSPIPNDRIASQLNQTQQSIASMEALLALDLCVKAVQQGLTKLEAAPGLVGRR